MHGLRCGLPLALRLPLRPFSQLRPQLSLDTMASHSYPPSSALISQAAAQQRSAASSRNLGTVSFMRRIGSLDAAASSSNSRDFLSSSPCGGVGSSRQQRRVCSATAAGTAAAEEAAAAEQAAGRGPSMILTDGTSLLYRAHYAFSEAHRLRNKEGEDTTVLFGFFNTLINLLELNPTPSHFAVVLDARGKTFRHELYEGYKGHRPETPAEVGAAMPKLLELLDAMAMPVLQVPGVEADDVIGTIACRAVQEGIAVAVASPDKDFFQLLRPGVMLLRPPKKAPEGQRFNKYALVPYCQTDFEQEWGVHPEQWVDVLALMGDSSDNVPGVQGIGPKTATALLQQWGTLENLLEHAAEIKPKKAAEQLSSDAGRAAARLSKHLVQIETELDLPPVQQPLEQLRLRMPADRGADLLRLFERLEFRKHAERMERLWTSPLYQ